MPYLSELAHLVAILMNTLTGKKEYIPNTQYIQQAPNNSVYTEDKPVYTQDIASPNADMDKMLKVIQEQQRLIDAQKHLINPAPVKEPAPNHNIALQEVQLPIGFYNEKEREEQLTTLYKQQLEPYIQEYMNPQIQYIDKHTVEHRNFRSGKIEHLDYKTVNNRLSIYLLKIKKSFDANALNSIENQFEKLNYWINKRAEFVVKD